MLGASSGQGLFLGINYWGYLHAWPGKGIKYGLRVTRGHGTHLTDSEKLTTLFTFYSYLTRHLILV